jgi:hypothetical protein
MMSKESMNVLLDSLVLSHYLYQTQMISISEKHLNLLLLVCGRDDSLINNGRDQLINHL